MTIDINKKYTTADGQAVRILAVDAPGRYPVIGLIGATVRRWTDEGHSASGCVYFNLVEVVPTAWRTVGNTAGRRGLDDNLQVGLLHFDSLEELRALLPDYKFAGEFRGDTLLRVVAL